MMELVKITCNGQITLPINIRRALGLKDGDKIAFVEANGQYILANPATLAVAQLQADFAEFAEEMRLQSKDDVVAMVKEIRAERARNHTRHQSLDGLFAGYRGNGVSTEFDTGRDIGREVIEE